MRFKGSVTVEASLLFPLILMVIVISMYALFFIHDRAVLDAAAYEAALRGCEITSEKADIRGKVALKCEESVKGRLLSTKDLNTDIEITGQYIRVRFSGEFAVPGGVNPVPGAGFKRLEIKAEGHSDRRTPMSYVRQFRTAENAADTLRRE